jgi:hypothetical protein
LGKYNPASSTGCVACAAGLYGATTGLTTPACTGPCTAGYACPAASTSATQVVCTVGRYSLAGAGACTPCAAGLFGTTQGLATAACTAPCPMGSFGSSSGLATSACTGFCPAGTYGETEGLSTASCSGPCASGHACVAGSITATAVMCTTGRYSPGGTDVCSLCSAGYVCPPGSASATPAATICAPGKYSLAGDASCSLCSAGRFGSSSGATSAACTLACPRTSVCVQRGGCDCCDS